MDEKQSKSANYEVLNAELDRLALESRAVAWGWISTPMGNGWFACSDLGGKCLAELAIGSSLLLGVTVTVCDDEDTYGDLLQRCDAHCFQDGAHQFYGKEWHVRMPKADKGDDNV